MIQDNLVNGNIVNEFDEVVGSYKHIAGNKYYVKLYNNTYYLTQNELKEKVLNLDLYTEQVWD